jgi:hypothetical protein
VFVLEVLHNIIFSLSLAHHDDSSLGTADRLANVLLAFARVVVRNASALLKSNPQRRQHADLRQFIDWLFAVCLFLYFQVFSFYLLGDNDSWKQKQKQIKTKNSKPERSRAGAEWSACR